MYYKQKEIDDIKTDVNNRIDIIDQRKEEERKRLEKEQEEKQKIKSSLKVKIKTYK